MNVLGDLPLMALLAAVIGVFIFALVLLIVGTKGLKLDRAEKRARARFHKRERNR